MKTLLLPLLLAVAAPVFAATDFQTFQAADVVLGQPDFTTTTATNGQPNRFSISYSAAMDPTTGKVFVADYGNNRVLRFSSAAAAQSSSNPEAVFGQMNFTASTANQGGAVSASTLSNPVSVSVDSSGRLWVADFSNNRVLGFYLASYLSNDPPADIVVGQANFTTSAAATTQTGLTGPVFATVGPDDTLWVSDYGNNRILRYATITAKPVVNASADGVLGQTLFTTSATSATANGLLNPAQLFPDSAGRLWVADYGHNRVLRFDGAAALANGAAATVALGQPDLITVATGLSSTKMNTPAGVYFDAGGNLWVAELGNKRVIRFAAAASLSTGSGANLVLGQPNFTTAGTPPSAQTLAGPWNIAAGANGSLLVADVAGNRVLRFSPVTTPGSTPHPRVVVPGPKVYSTASARVLLRGRAADAGGTLARVQVKVNRRPYRNAAGLANWRFFANLQSGRNAILVRAVDVSGTMSSAVRLTITRTP
jgi:sugar lactone lactonase YvrE